MKKIIMLSMLLAISFLSYTQTPTIYDCLGAIPLCDSTYHQPNTLNTLGNFTGEINVPSNQCLIDELGGIWYKFTPSTTDTLRFSIIPDNPAGEDFDWALFDLTNVSCDSLALGNPYNYLIAGNSAGASSVTPPLQNQGITGINSDSAIAGSSNCLGPGAGDGTGIAPGDWNTFDEDVVVQVGHTYYLYVAQFSGSQGYTIDFRPSQASIISNDDATITPIDTLCVASANIYLNAVDSDGIWSGTGITDSINGVFNPTIANSGIHQITYTISGVCPISDTTYVTILPNPVSSFGYNITNELCLKTIFQLTNNSLNSNTYKWYTDGSFYSNSENEIFSIPFKESTNISLIATNGVCKDTSNIIITAPNAPSTFIPNVFTPNNDGINDVFDLPDNIKNCATNIQIFNRWGKLVYKSDHILNWNGKTTAGRVAKEGTYFYTIKINEKEYKGSLTLLK